MLHGGFDGHRAADRDARLYRLEPNGRVSTIQDSIAIANGVAFSPDGRRLYYADTANYVSYACDYDPPSDRTGTRSVLLDTQPLNARPDGATVDAEGCLWSALVDTGQLARIAPDGRLAELVDLGVPFVTCPVFAGPDLDQMFLTSLRQTQTMQVDHPLAGKLFRLEGIKAHGVPETPAMIRAGPILDRGDPERRACVESFDRHSPVG